MAVVTKYDRQDVVQKATDLLWGKGYHATSLQSSC